MNVRMVSSTWTNPLPSVRTLTRSNPSPAVRGRRPSRPAPVKAQGRLRSVRPRDDQPVASGTDGVGRRAHIDALAAQHPGDERPQPRFGQRQETSGHLHDRHSATEPRQRLSQLAPDRSSAKDHQPCGQLVDSVLKYFVPGALGFAVAGFVGWTIIPVLAGGWCRRGGLQWCGPWAWHDRSGYAGSHCAQLLEPCRVGEVASAENSDALTRRPPREMLKVTVLLVAREKREWMCRSA
jgi:hypothetical protein